jgi:hypothetical protein
VLERRRGALAGRGRVCLAVGSRLRIQPVDGLHDDLDGGCEDHDHDSGHDHDRCDRHDSSAHDDDRCRDDHDDGSGHDHHHPCERMDRGAASCPDDHDRRGFLRYLVLH